MTKETDRFKVLDWLRKVRDKMAEDMESMTPEERFNYIRRKEHDDKSKSQKQSSD